LSRPQCLDLRLDLLAAHRPQMAHNVGMNDLTTFYFELTTDSEGPFPVLIIATGLKIARAEIQKTANLKSAKQITEQEFLIRRSLHSALRTLNDHYLNCDLCDRED
jgi:hypothetical protein